MKSSTSILLALILVIGIANLLSALGIIGGGGGDWEYRVMNAQEMDSVGFKAVAKELGIEPDEQGKMELPVEKAQKTALLPSTIEAVEDEGWKFVSVTSDHHYIFRRPN